MLARALLTKVIRCEHRHLLTALVRLTIALGERNPARFRKQLESVTALLAVQFRYEEEALFPALVPVLHTDSVEALLAAHDEIISGMESLEAVAAADTIPETQVNAAAAVIWRVLENQYASERLTVLFCELTEDAAKSVFTARGTALDEQVDLTTWATSKRTHRPDFRAGQEVHHQQNQSANG